MKTSKERVLIIGMPDTWEKKRGLDPNDASDEEIEGVVGDLQKI